METRRLNFAIMINVQGEERFENENGTRDLENVAHLPNVLHI